MKGFIQIHRIHYEEPYHVHLIFKASNGVNSGQLEIFDHADRLKELADILEDFPFQSTKDFSWELGSEISKENFAFYFKCRFSLIEYSSHCVISIRMNNNQDGIERIISEFHIHCYPAEINTLGQLFRQFSTLDKERLTWNGSTGKVD